MSEHRYEVFFFLLAPRYDLDHLLDLSWVKCGGKEITFFNVSPP